MPLSKVLSVLPLPLLREIRTRFPAFSDQSTPISEIRIRLERQASLSVFEDGKLCNLPLSYIADTAALQTILAKAAGGSVYAYEREMVSGFLPLSHGIRLGVAGRAVSKENGMLSLTAIDSLVFRLPAGMPSAEALFRFYRNSTGGILLFAPPGGGKTSLLRAFTRLAAKEARVSLIDAREEFDLPDPHLLLDHLRGYPKAVGAELAVRTLSPELLVIDEIGKEEAAALTALVSHGVRTLAAVHGECADALLSAPALAPLLASGVFSHLWDVRRSLPYPIQKETDQ